MGATFQFVKLRVDDVESDVSFRIGKWLRRPAGRFERKTDMIEILWLAMLAMGLTFWVVRDAGVYRRFKAVEDTAIRQRFYWRWTGESFFVLTGASLVTLWLLGRLGAWTALPGEFAALSLQLSGGGAAARGGAPSGDEMIGFAIGATMGLAVVVFVSWRRLRRMLSPAEGGVEPLLPRNARERLIAIPLSINAGFSEELFFRLALPLLLVHVTGSVLFAFAAATAAFGLAHAYQGWKGILGTGLVGGLLAFQYLASGSLLKVMIIHAAIDIVAFVLRPAIAGWMVARAERAGGSAHPQLPVG